MEYGNCMMWDCKDIDYSRFNAVFQIFYKISRSVFNVSNILYLA